MADTFLGNVKSTIAKNKANGTGPFGNLDPVSNAVASGVDGAIKAVGDGANLVGKSWARFINALMNQKSGDQHPNIKDASLAEQFMYNYNNTWEYNKTKGIGIDIGPYIEQWNRAHGNGVNRSEITTEELVKSYLENPTAIDKSNMPDSVKKATKVQLQRLASAETNTPLPSWAAQNVYGDFAGVTAEKLDKLKTSLYVEVTEGRMSIDDYKSGLRAFGYEPTSDDISMLEDTKKYLETTKRK